MSDTPEFIVARLAGMQRPDGLFPATRINPAWLYKRLDTNVFFTATIVFALQQLRPLLSAGEQQLADVITGKATPGLRTVSGIKTA